MNIKQKFLEMDIIVIKTRKSMVLLYSRKFQKNNKLQDIVEEFTQNVTMQEKEQLISRVHKLRI